MSRGNSVTRTVYTSVRISSVQWDKTEPDVSVFLDFAKQLQKHVDAGLITTKQPVRIDEGQFVLYNSATERTEEIDVDALLAEMGSDRLSDEARATLKPKRPTVAAAILSRDSEEVVEYPEDRYATDVEG